MKFPVRLTTEGKNLVKEYAKIHDISLDEVLKQAVVERSKDVYDVIVAELAYSEYVNSGKKSRPISELWHELDL